MDLTTLVFLLLFIGLVLDAVIIALFIYAAGKAWEARPDIMGAPSAEEAATGAERRKEGVRSAWADIMSSSGKGAEGKRLAVINADRLVDRLLQDAGYPGAGALDRMKALPHERVATANGLMHAHRLRNRLVHEASYAPDDRELDAALAQYQAFLTEVGYL